MDIDHTLIVAILIIIVIIAIARYSNDCTPHEGLTNNEIGSIISAIDMVEKNKGNVLTFYNIIGDYKFSPLAYAKLTSLYNRGELTIPNARRVVGV